MALLDQKQLKLLLILMLKTPWERCMTPVRNFMNHLKRLKLLAVDGLNAMIQRLTKP